MAYLYINDDLKIGDESPDLWMLDLELFNIRGLVTLDQIKEELRKLIEKLDNSEQSGDIIQAIHVYSYILMFACKLDDFDDDEKVRKYFARSLKYYKREVFMGEIISDDKEKIEQDYTEFKKKFAETYHVLFTFKDVNENEL